nr:hypothetical protein [Klebsiella pneumoniae]
MTKSTITRERLQEMLEWCEVFRRRPRLDDIAEAIRMALAAMDSKPDCKERKLFCSTDTARMRKVISASAGSEATPLCRHAQPAPVVPDERDKTVDADDHPLLWSFNEGWNACRAAMLAVAPQPQNAPQNIPEIIPGGLVEAVNNLLNNDGSRGCYDAMECNAARVEIELWLAQRQRQREQRKTNLSAGISPVIPEGWQVEAEKLAEIYGMSFVLFRHGEVPQCADPTKVVISFTDKGLGHDTLPAAHQEVKGE